MHLLKHVGHWPLGGGGAAQLNSLVTETSDQFDDVSDDVTRLSQLIAADNVQVGYLGEFKAPHC